MCCPRPFLEAALKAHLLLVGTSEASIKRPSQMVDMLMIDAHTCSQSESSHQSGNNSSEMLTQREFANLLIFIENFGCQADAQPTDVVLLLNTSLGAASRQLEMCQYSPPMLSTDALVSTSCAKTVAKLSAFTAMKCVAPRRLQICQQTPLW